MNGPLNKSLSNGPWKKKEGPLAEHSVLFLNKCLVSDGPQIWDEAAIEERARWLHATAVKVWPHCGNMGFLAEVDDVERRVVLEGALVAEYLADEVAVLVDAGFLGGCFENVDRCHLSLPCRFGR